MPEPSRLSLHIHAVDGEATVQCSGKLVAGVTDTLYTEVKQLIPGSKCIVLDLTDLSQMDSMGLGTVVRLLVSAKSSGCRLELVNFNKRIRELLGITNLLSVFEVCGEQRMKLP
jgi:anti-sigma B factor antagonist